MATKLGEKIRSYRTKKGLTLEALAHQAGLSKSYLWELENRESQRPSAEKLQGIADVLGVDVSFFVDDSVDNPQEAHRDKQFFRNFSKLDEDSKEQLRRILETFRKPN
ncbi:helix-turn-helix domain-containing protein [Polaromonas sp. JS666]|uniref:helix-turn-helix domain-containing protein n=1 Tax=Polaromonas sp. (strain JS666 / ATCC BAA-500) TaxID=296591 RepID=UPI00005354CA|nr:helix-turn-helix transcriptional regulator [Polaromonas sp. JS666]ABE47024.1 transcriptional regulator, XRE family [Polaromonas sp. JS666]